MSKVSPDAAPSEHEPAPSVLSLREFCARNRISRSTWFKMRREGCAPRVMKFGNLTRITAEAERDWRAQMEAYASSEKSKLEQARRSEHLRQLGKLAAESPAHISNVKKRTPRSDVR
jgi:hypothetical protein